ncbi:hypothetical protein O181_011167 [Austropuccinia psidii MF-1]|uniref:Nucleolar complex protein 2 homolog n=1 Tax=Austropuccinia psidii MF-1 TaxID=1389203 RepID=A0A9Q3BV72_9BASI|nr:hypothetical protein [Austropuccinia psidii MF-1]
MLRRVEIGPPPVIYANKACLNHYWPLAEFRLHSQLRSADSMAGKKVSKRTKKFTRDHLSHTIAARRKHQSRKKEIENRKHHGALKSSHNGKGASQKCPNNKSGQEGSNKDPSEDEDEDESMTKEDNVMDMSVDALLNARGLGSDGSESGDSNESDEDDDLNSIGGIDDEPMSRMDFKMLKEKDPEFYKYLQENDKDLLEFNPDEIKSDEGDQLMEEGAASTAEEVDIESLDGHKQLVLTKDMLRAWKKAILQNRSIRTLRKLLLAFKSAAFCSSEANLDLPFAIESSSVFNALVTTTFKYLPVFLNQTLPAKALSNGKFKLATHSKSYALMQRILKSYFTSLIELIAQLPTSSGQNNLDTQGDLLYIAINESAKLSPWVVGNRKIMRIWIKNLLDLWSSSADSVRIAAILALRRLAVAADSTTMTSIIKGTYTKLVRSSKHITAFTLPMVNLMKNSASEIFLINPELSYPIVFSYIRQLAIHLRNSMKLKSKEGFQAVYNWQFVHSLDFWSLVLSAAHANTSKSKPGPSPLLPLIYPLVQITTGVIKLIPTSRYFPLRFHCIKLLLRLNQKTQNFIPLAPLLLDVFDSPLFKQRPKLTSLKPLDWEYIVRCPKSHENTRIYADGVAEETTYLLLEYFATFCKSIAFPELVLPALVMLKRVCKHLKNQKLVGQLRTLVEKLEANKVWVEERRTKLNFGSQLRKEIDEFLGSIDSERTPLGNHLKLQAKMRNQKRVALDKSTRNEEEIVDS